MSSKIEDSPKKTTKLVYAGFIYEATEDLKTHTKDAMTCRVLSPPSIELAPNEGTSVGNDHLIICWSRWQLVHTKCQPTVHVSD